MKTCPFCCCDIPAEAVVCAYCTRDLPQPNRAWIPVVLALVFIVAAISVLNSGGPSKREIAARATVSAIAAPAGDAGPVAQTVLKDSGRDCPALRSAIRRADGTIVAWCSNGQRYLVSTLQPAGIATAMSCTALVEHGEGSCDG